MLPNVLLDTWIIMPNHIHAIFEIMSTGVETRRGASPQNQFGQIFRNSIPVIINQFKGSVVRRINQKYGPGHFAWQPRYYDHIIADEREYNNVAQYILDNPSQWPKDENNPVNFKNAK